ncbi:MAG: hypothetical protein PHP11_00740 [Erysipelotrichaceae bacterium]|nr:hypothetical protein [Erysipelotrichaceae bacterium]
MKKLIVILVSLILLGNLNGCSFSTVDQDNLLDIMNETVSKTVSEVIPHFQNMNKEYYSYYLAHHVGRRKSTAYSNLFIIENQEVLMSIKPSSIIIDKYYGNFDSSQSIVVEDALFSSIYEYTDIKEKKQKFTLTVFNSDDHCYMLIESDAFTFVTQAEIDILPTIAADVIRILRTTSVNEEAVITAYSRKESIDYQQETTIFSQSVPENGTLAEMLENYFPDYDFSVDSQNYSQEDAGLEDYLHDIEE